MPRTVRDEGVLHRRWRRCIALAAVLAIHIAFVVVLLLPARPLLTPRDETASLLLVEVPPEVPPSVDRPKDLSRALAHRRRPQPGKQDRKADAGGPEAPPINQANPPSAIDWSMEAQRTASDVASRLGDNIGKCNEKGDPSSKLPLCPERPRNFEWSAKKQRAGLQNGFLYFRPTENCIIGFGIAGLAAGCTLGKEEANGHLFDGMKSPDRRSSVPDTHDNQR